MPIHSYVYKGNNIWDQTVNSDTSINVTFDHKVDNVLPWLQTPSTIIFGAVNPDDTFNVTNECPEEIICVKIEDVVLHVSVKIMDAPHAAVHVLRLKLAGIEVYEKLVKAQKKVQRLERKFLGTL